MKIEVSRARCPYTSAMSHFYHVFVSSTNSLPIMDVQHMSRGCAFSESSLISLTRQQELSAFQFGFPAATNSRPFSIGNNKRTIKMEGRSCLQPLEMQRNLPQKRSNQSLTSLGAEGQVESHSNCLPSINSAKRLKGAITPLSNPPSPCNDVVKTSMSQPLPDFLKAQTKSPERVDPAECSGDQTHCDRSKTLRSPFEYTQELVPTQVDSSAKADVQRFHFIGSLCDEKSLGYIYYAPTNPSDTTSQASEARRRIPRRQLSYGDLSSKPRSLHKSAGSRELRREAERQEEDYDLGSWSDSTSNASATRPYHSELTRSKPRIWLDLSEQDKIQEAVSMGRNSYPSPC